MANPDSKPDASNAGGSAPNRQGPALEIVEQFRQLEARVDEVVQLVERLRRDNKDLEARLDAATQARAEAVRRIDELIDKIDRLL